MTTYVSSASFSLNFDLMFSLKSFVSCNLRSDRNIYVSLFLSCNLKSGRNIFVKSFAYTIPFESMSHSLMTVSCYRGYETAINGLSR